MTETIVASLPLTVASRFLVLSLRNVVLVENPQLDNLIGVKFDAKLTFERLFTTKAKYVS